MVICLHSIYSQVSTFYGVSVSVCVYVYTHICQSLLSFVLFFVCLLKGTVGLPHVFDIDHGLCGAAWLGVDQTSRCYQLIISRPQAYFWMSENTTQKNFHLHILGNSLIQKPPSRQAKCKALGILTLLEHVAHGIWRASVSGRALRHGADGYSSGSQSLFRSSH